MNYEEEAAALYALPPAQFTTARDVRIAELKGEKQAALAGRLKLLRRPTAAAWCVNLLAGAHREELRALVELGKQLAEAQRRADPAAIRVLSAERRRRVAALVGAAARLAAQSVLPRGEPIVLEPTVVADLEATLNAAVADAAVAERVLSGRLVRGESYAGFGPLPDEAPSTALSTARADGDTRLDAARAENAAADQAVVTARCERDATRRSRDVARHARDEAAAVLAEAERRLVEAERALVGAERTLQRAEDLRAESAARLDAAEGDSAGRGGSAPTSASGPSSVNGGGGPSGRRTTRSAARSR